MKIVQVAEAKKALAHHLEYVRRGGIIRIVDHDQPVADLVPIQAENGDDDDTQLARLERSGLVRRGNGGAIPSELLRPGPTGGRANVVDAIVQERRSSR